MPLELYVLMVVQVVEITKGSKVKYELDKKTGLIKVRIGFSCFSHEYLINYLKMGARSPTTEYFL